MTKFMTLSIAIIGLLIMVGCGSDEQAESPEKPATESQPAKTEMAASAETFTYDLANGERVFDEYCSLCHRMGVAGSASHADKRRWEESYAKGIPTLVSHAYNGYTGKYGVLPAKGGCMECSRQDIIDAVHYHLVDSGVMQAD